MSAFDPWNSFDYDAASVDAGSSSLLAGLGDNPLGLSTLPGDAADQAKMAGFVPAVGASQGQSWWESAMQYGIVRAIDNRFGAPQQVYGNVQPGYFAGQNGRTYTQTPRPMLAGSGDGGGLILLLAVGALVYAVAQ